MTIEQKAREIGLTVSEDSSVSWSQEPYAAARLGIIEGRRQAFEEAAQVADRIGTCSNTTGRSNCCEQTGEDIADAIRALTEEQK
jgi:hypothetical protein